MALNLPMYQSMLQLRDTTPYDYYKNFQQALINSQWTNTTTLYTVNEQEDINVWQFNEIQVHLNHAIAMVTKGLPNGDDFRKINFQNLDHEIVRGLYYMFDNNYWIVTFTDEAELLTKNVMVRRCNNWLRWVDKNTGKLIEYPCVVAYDATSPQNQIDNDIITPNNGLFIIVQGNNDTLTIETNQRFILNGRPFKIAGYNNALMESSIDESPNLLYFDTYLDEISPYDDLNNGIANNFEPINIIGYQSGQQIIPPAGNQYIQIEPYVESINQGQSVIITAKVIDSNGDSTESNVICNPSNANPKNYILENLGNNQFKITNLKMDSDPLGLQFISGDLIENMVVVLKSLF